MSSITTKRKGEREYELLPNRHDSDEIDTTSEEETFFESPRVRALQKKSGKGKSFLGIPFSRRNILLVCGVVVGIIVLVVFFTVVVGSTKPAIPSQFDVTSPSDSQASDYNGTRNGTLWSREFNPSQSGLSLLEHDINQDGIPDLILDIRTWRIGQEKYLVCPQKPNSCLDDVGYAPCRVRIVALDGRNGSIIWEKWVEFTPFAADCKHDLNNDGVPDCTFSGRVGALAVINPVDGSYIWVVDPALTFPLYSYYYPLFIRDFDRDGIIDLIVTHGGDPLYQPSEQNRSPGFIFVVSGRTGQQLSERIPMPDGHETYSSPIAFNATGSVEVVLFGSGGETISGSLWAITVQSLQEHVDSWTPNRAERYRPNKYYFDPHCLNNAEIESMRPTFEKDTFKHVNRDEDWMSFCSVLSKDSEVIWNSYKLCVYEFVPAGETGTMLPPVVIDFNRDGIKDLLVSQFNDHTIMVDGASGDTQWDHVASDIQSYSVPAPLNFNGDRTPDVLVRFNKGKWMFYDYSYMGVLDGKSGDLLWTLNCSMGAMSSAVTVKSSKNGNDGMLFLAIGCEDNKVNHKAKERSVFNEFNEHICPRAYIYEEQKTCEAERRNKRHGEEMSVNHEEETVEGSESHPKPSQIDFSKLADNIPTDLWEARDETDTFPDPWTNTRSFVQEYCDIPYDRMISRVYYLTPNMIKSGNIKPLYENKPYVYKPPSSGYLSRRRRDESSSIDEGKNGDGVDVLKNRKMIRCAHILLPWMMQSTPTIGDFNKDGRLDAAMSVLYDGMPNESYMLSLFHPSKVLVKAFTISDRVVEVYGPEILKIVDFSSYYPADKQPWGQYMGLKGNGVYESPSS